MDVPEEQAARGLAVRQPAVAVGDEARHDRNRPDGAEDSTVIEPEPGGREVQHDVDGPLGALDAVDDLVDRSLGQPLQLGAPGDHSAHVSQQPVQAEVVPGVLPAAQTPLQLVPGLGPARADLGQRQVAFRQLGAARVGVVEELHDHINGLVLAGDRLLVELDVADVEEPVETGVDALEEHRIEGPFLTEAA